MLTNAFKFQNQPNPLLVLLRKAGFFDGIYTHVYGKTKFRLKKNVLNVIFIKSGFIWFWNWALQLLWMKYFVSGYTVKPRPEAHMDTILLKCFWRASTWFHNNRYYNGTICIVDNVIVLSDLVESSGYSSKTLQKRIMSICASGRGFTVYAARGSNHRPADDDSRAQTNALRWIQSFDSIYRRLQCTFDILTVGFLYLKLKNAKPWCYVIPPEL